MRFSKFVQMANAIGNGGMDCPTAIPDLTGYSGDGKTKISLRCSVGVDVETDNELLGAILGQGNGGSIRRLSKNERIKSYRKQKQ